MKIKLLTTVLLFSFNFICYGQSVIQEAAPMTEEQKRVKKIRQEIAKVEASFAKGYEQLDGLYFKYRPNEAVLNPTKGKLEQKLQNIEQMQYEIKRLNLKELCTQINALRSSIGEKQNECSSLAGRVNKLDESHRRVRNDLAALQKKQGEEATDKMIHEKDLKNLDKEIASLDAILASSKSSPPKKSKSLDDFLLEKSKTKSTNSLDAMLTSSANKKTTKSNSLDDMFASSGNKKSTKSNSLDAMLQGSNSKSTGNGLDDLIIASSNETDFKIDYKNGLSGVINSKGKILIPYKDWRIREYKMGIAKVLIAAESFSCSQVKYANILHAYKSGFVDKQGDFIDGFEIVIEEERVSRPLTLTVVKKSQSMGLTESYEQYQARLEREKREEERGKREKERREKQDEIDRKKCRIDKENWKKSIIAKYQ